ncbi:MAG TPA: carbohydrate kinase family protein [Anaerolineales bacterium]|nr:carbohydrate kinase family protein [Anaerolineales bacterium]
MRIVFSGSIAYDYLMTFPGYFRDFIHPEKMESLSLSFLVDSLSRHYGGIAPNIAYSYALLGGKPVVLGTAGDDFDDYRQWLNSKGVDTSAVKQIPGVKTASFFANTDQANLQIASFYAGAMAYADQVTIADLPFRPDLVVISPDDPTAMRNRIRECAAAGIPYLYDPSQQLARVSVEDIREGVQNAKMIVVNDYEAHMIENRTGLTEADMVLGNKILVVTRGNEGATIYADGQRHDVPVFPEVTVVDPTGTGDAFRGGFLRGVALGLSWELNGRMGALAATYCLEQKGTQNHSFTPAEFVERFRTVFDDGGKLNKLLQ